MRGIRGVRSAALTAGLPLTSEGLGLALSPEGYEFPAGQQNIQILGYAVDENYFTTLGVPIATGRGFQSSDRPDSPKVIVANQEFARRFFNGNAVGKRVRLDEQNGEWAEVIGVTTTGKYNGITESPMPVV